MGSFRKDVTFGADELRSGGILPFGFQSEAFAHSARMGSVRFRVDAQIHWLLLSDHI
jgi:hypothetical protein